MVQKRNLKKNITFSSNCFSLFTRFQLDSLPTFGPVECCPNKRINPEELQLNVCCLKWLPLALNKLLNHNAVQLQKPEALATELETAETYL